MVQNENHKPVILVVDDNPHNLELVLAYLEDLDCRTIAAQGGMEALEIVQNDPPDLVLLGYTTKDTYGAILETAGIPTYYVDAGHTVSYESIKAQTEALIAAFDPQGEAGKEILERFVKLEARLTEEKTRNAGKTVMVLQSSPPSHYIQSNIGTLGSMADMLGFENVYHAPQAPMVLLDLEVALSYNPDYIFSVGALPSGEEQQKSMEEDFANNPDYWNAIPAIKEGRILYLPIGYISSAGINVVDNINLLIDQVHQLTD